MRRVFSDLTKACAVDEYVAGGQPTTIARKYGIDPNTVRQWTMQAGRLSERRIPKNKRAHKRPDRSKYDDARMICHYLCDVPIPSGRHKCRAGRCRSMATKVSAILVIGYGVQALFVCDACCAKARITIEEITTSPHGLRAEVREGRTGKQNDYYPVPGARMVLP